MATSQTKLQLAGNALAAVARVANVECATSCVSCADKLMRMTDLVAGGERALTDANSLVVRNPLPDVLVLVLQLRNTSHARCRVVSTVDGCI
jgi:hypothetical protein